MKVVEIVVAVIKEQNHIFVAQRGFGEWKGYWEFPGGKVEAGEEKESALIREIKEELNTEIKIDSFVQTTEYDYKKFHLIMHSYICHVVSGELELLEHEDAKWLTQETLNSVKWLPANLDLIKQLSSSKKLSSII